MNDIFSFDILYFGKITYIGSTKPSLTASHMASHTYGVTYIWRHIHMAHIHMASHTHGVTYTWRHIHMASHTYGVTYIWRHIHMASHTSGVTYIWHFRENVTGSG
jgi:hypothetical protein